MPVSDVRHRAIQWICLLSKDCGDDSVSLCRIYCQTGLWTYPPSGVGGCSGGSRLCGFMRSCPGADRSRAAAQLASSDDAL